jgi:hypothetical protein
MRMGVVLRAHNPVTDAPTHFISSKLARQWCHDRVKGKLIAIQHSKHLIHLQVDVAFRELKRMYSAATLAGTRVQVHKLNPPEPGVCSLNLGYPVLGQETDARRRRAQVWAAATKF